MRTALRRAAEGEKPAEGVGPPDGYQPSTKYWRCRPQSGFMVTGGS